MGRMKIKTKNLLDRSLHPAVHLTSICGYFYP